MDVEDPYGVAEELRRQDPLVFIPIRKGRSTLSVERRLELLQMELGELDAEFESSPQEAAPKQEDVVCEMQEIAQRANTLAKAIGTATVDLTVKGEIPRMLAASIAGVLTSGEQEATYELQTSYPEKVNEEALDVASSASRLASRISKLEATIGLWKPSHGFLSISQSHSMCRKTLSVFDPKLIKVLSSQAEDIKSELEMISYQKDMLLGSSMDHQAVEELYDKLTELNAVQPVLELLVKRLSDLKRVHEEGAEFKARLGKVSEQLVKAEQKLKETGISELVEKWGKFKSQVSELLTTSISS